MQFTAGQFTELTLPHPHPDNRGIRRQFTISSTPTDKFISITTRIHAQDESTFKHTLVSLAGGEEVDLAEPMGDFVLPKLIQTPLVFVAGGIGITPFLSILRYLAQTGEQRNVSLLYGVNNEDDIIGTDTFRAADLHATIVVNEPSVTWGGERGRLSGERILQLSSITDDSLVYLSGPESMVTDIKEELLSKNIQQHQLVTDAFLGYKSV